jgi:PAS domain S-box-containing protein
MFGAPTNQTGGPTVPDSMHAEALDVPVLRDIVDVLPLMVNIKDRASRYVYMNAFQAALYGTTPDDAVGHTAAELLGADYGGYTHDIDPTVLESGRTFANLSETYRMADGTERSFLTTKLPWRRADGGIAGIVTIALDVSEKKAGERALADALVRSEAANRAKAAFLSNMSHELRTPLNAVIGFAELLAGAGVANPARVADYAGSVVAGARRLHDVIDGVLEIARLDAGTHEHVAAPFALAPLVAECLADADAAALAAKVSLSAAIPGDLPDLVADRRALRRMIDALLSNAIKFSPAGGPVRVTADRGAPGGGVRVEVADGGIGIAPADMPHVLEPFGQVEGALARRFGGTGLGLTVVRMLMEVHGGALELDSSAGAGTRARLLFPPSATPGDNSTARPRY